MASLFHHIMIQCLNTIMIFTILAGWWPPATSQALSLRLTATADLFDGHIFQRWDGNMILSGYHCHRWFSDGCVSPPNQIWPPGGAPESNLSSYMLVHWVKVIWAKYGGSGTPWGLTIIFFRKKSTSLNPMTLDPTHSL